MVFRIGKKKYMAKSKAKTEEPIKSQIITDEELLVVKGIFSDLLKMLGVDGTFDAKQTDEGVDIVLDTQDSGIVIGYHGEVLEALQLITSLCVSKKIGRFVRISVEVGEYKRNRTDWLEHLAMQAKEQALAEQKEVPLQNLKSWERRIVHLYLQNDKDVVSESIGEGKERTLIVKPRV